MSSVWQTPRVAPRTPLLVSVLLVLAGCSAPTQASPPAAGTVNCEYPAAGNAAKPVHPPRTTGVSTVGTAAFTLTMTGGTVTIRGDRSAAPCTLNSFESLAAQGYFDGTSCHRLADLGMFLVQCGDPTGTGRGGPGYRFADEVDPATRYPAGVVAMANAGADTNGSQFFVIYRDSELPPAYTVFGRVDTASLQVIEAMAAEGHDNVYGDSTGRPRNAFRIERITLA